MQIHIHKLKYILITTLMLLSLGVRAAGTKHERKFKGSYLIEDIHYRILDDSTLEKKAKLTYYYDSIQMLKDTILSNLTMTTKDGETRPKLNDQYYFRVKPQYRAYAKWDVKKQEWVNITLNKLAYDTINKSVSSFKMKWDEELNDWSTVSKTIRILNENLEVSNNKYYKYDKKNNGWSLIYEEQFEYKNGKKVQSITLNYEDNKLTDKIKSTFEFDSIGNQIKEVCYYAKKNSSSWDMNYINEMTFTNKVLKSKTTSTFTDNLLTKKTRMTDEHDKNGKRISRYWENYNFTRNKWEEQDRKTAEEFMLIIENSKKGIKYEGD